jgi:hypothetical protein
LKQGAGFVLYALMDAVVDRYFPIIESFESEKTVVRGWRLPQRGAQAESAVAPCVLEYVLAGQSVQVAARPTASE